MDTTLFYEIDGLYLVQNTGRGEYYGIIADGIPIKKGDVLAARPENVYAEQKQKRITHYTDAEDNTLSIEEMRGQKEMLKQSGGYNDDECTWKSIDAEYDYKKLERRWEPVYVEDVTKTSVPFEVISLNYKKENLPPYTQPCRLVGALPNEKNYTLFQYSPNKFAMLKEQADALGLVYVDKEARSFPEWSTFKQGDPSGIRCGKYYADNNKLNKFKSCIGTLDECKQAHDDNMLLIKGFWDYEISKNDNQIISKATYSYVLSELRNLKLNLNKVVSTVKTDREYKSCVTKVQNLEALIAKTHAEENV